MEDLTPLYNKEFYLAYLCGEDVVLPIPDGNAERYLAYLCGMDVTIPDVPDGRTETYLAYKCGEDVVLPDPMYRIEFYLAKWCGIDCEVPEPMYRIEYWLAQLANSGEIKTVTGNPISVSDALAKPAESLVIEILPQQDLQGYANPWPAGGGKNILSTAGLVAGTPSSTAFANTTPRTFTVGTYVTGITNNNYCQNLDIGAVVSDNSVKFSTSAKAYGVGIPIIGLEVGSKYAVSAVTTIGRVGLSFYQQDGTFISGGSATAANHSPYVATVPENTYYTLVCFDSTENNSETTFTNIQLEKSEAATSYAPYSNICPISGHDSVKVWVKPTYDPTANPTATIQLGQTVYGGTLDVTTGVLTVTGQIFDMASVNWSRDPSRPGVFYCGISSKESGFSPILACSCYKLNNVGVTTDEDLYISGANSYGKGAFVRDTSKSAMTGTEFKNSLSGQTLVYKLATPITIQLTPTEIEMLLGDNVIWNDVGDMVLEYLADGPADDIDALQILLNNRYVNNGEPDEATDKEALEILLGGNTR